MSTDYIRYDLLVQDALRSVVRKVLSDAARTGLPGEHHFNISFKTQAPGVVIPAAMRQRYPDEMAIILQHEFWDLAVTAETFEVSLNFSRKPERLSIPFDSITGFSDPSVPFGFKLEPRMAAETAPNAASPTPAAKPAPAAKLASTSPVPHTLTPAPKVAKPASVETKPAEFDAKPAKTEAKSADAAAKSAPTDSPAPAKVVSIDAFRKK